MVIQAGTPDTLGAHVGTEARSLALQWLYANDLRGSSDVIDVFAWLCEEEDAPATVRQNAQSLVAGIVDNAGALDEAIQRYAPALPVNMLAIVDRNILRVAIYELTCSGQVPQKVIISEATELASKFGSESSARFVNGVLGSVLDNLTPAAN